MTVGELFIEASRRIGRDRNEAEKYVSEIDMETVATAGFRWSTVKVKVGREEAAVCELVRCLKMLQANPGLAQFLMEAAERTILEQNKRS